MKEILKTALLVALITTMLPTTSSATSVIPTTTYALEKYDPVEEQKLIDRLVEIKEMDITSLTRKEKKDLRHEVRSIESKLDDRGRGHGEGHGHGHGYGGVYISVGGGLFLLILLIILL